jgi:protein disulfide-isomerase-like protein
MKSYHMSQGEINEENIMKFYNDWIEGKLTRHIKSQPVPTNHTVHDGAYVLVGSNLEEYVINNNKDVVIIFYAPWCKHSKEFVPIYDALAKKLKKTSPHVLMAKFDAHYNEAVLIDVGKYPTVAIWPAGNKKEFIEFPAAEERTETNLINFIKSHVTAPIFIEERDSKNKEPVSDL